MLVLTRKIGESIKINEDVKITVIDVKGKNIRLGIEAPRETKIYREEVFLRIKEENQTAVVRINEISLWHTINTIIHSYISRTII